MGNFFSSLSSVAAGMRVHERALNTIQNNVSNASTPGYVRQRLTMVALPFSQEGAQTGGVAAGPILSARDEYAERSVRNQQEGYGYHSQLATDLARIEPVFTVAENAGIPGALSKFFQSFSVLSVSPNDPANRQVVIDRAQDVATAFNQTAIALVNASQNANRQIDSVIDKINSIACTIQEINLERRQNFRERGDAGLDARLHVALEELSELVNYSALPQEDGSITVLIGGQTPLVIGDRLYELDADVSGAGETQILNPDGRNITGQLTGGRLGALLEFRNTVIPSLVDDVNRFAASVANNVNTVLSQGVDASGQPPALDLFSLDAAAGAALTLHVDPACSGDDIAASLPPPAPPGGNGNLLELSALPNSKQFAELDNFTFAEFYGKLAGRVGRSLSNARENQNTQSLLLTQARAFRSEVSSVSLDEEAVMLIQLQRGYQASAQLVRTIDELTETVIGMMR